MKTIVGISILLMSLIQYVYAEPIINVKYSYYPVKVTKVDYLLESLNKSSEIIEDGEKYHAHTETYINWTFNWLSDKTGCHIVDTNIEVDISYILPVFVPENVTHKLLNLLESYYKSLLLHENGHANIAINAAKQIEIELMSMSKSSSCTALEADANKVATHIVDQYAKQHKHYDIQTEHGKTQGAYIGDYIDH